MTMMQALANGDWLTVRRIRLVGLLLLATTLVAYGALLSGAHGTLDALGRPIGTDFSDVYAAGWMADHDRAAQAWIWADHYAVQQAIHHSRTVDFYGWHYPPPFLLVAALLACLPYLPALFIWQAATLSAALAVLHRIQPGRDVLLVALAAPATFVCLGHGQNGFLTAALLGGGVMLIDRRPWIAGLLLGCLCYKPQFAVLLPVVLIARPDRRALAGAAIASLGLIGATLAIWGWPVWNAFFQSLPLTQSVVIEQGSTGWSKIVTSFAAARALGAPVTLAYAIQGVSTGLALIAAAATSRWARVRLRGATLCCAALLSTPYALDYDLVILGPAIALLVADGRERGWLAWEKSVLAFAYCAPLAGRQIADVSLIPIDWLAILALFAVTLRRVWQFEEIAMALPRLRSSPYRHSHGASGR